MADHGKNAKPAPSDKESSAVHKRYKGFGTTAIHAGHDQSQCDMNQVSPSGLMSQHEEPDGSETEASDLLETRLNVQ